MVSLRRRLRSCSSPMVATSASAWPTRRSSGWNGPELARKKVERPDDLAPQPHGQGLHGAEPGLHGRGGELGPSLARPGEVSRGDGLAGAEAVQAWSLAILDLEQLNQLGCLAGCRRYAQLAARVSEHDPGGGCGEQPDAAVGEHVQEVHDVEIGDHGVCQVDEGAGQ
jgi:hypothetical protein